MGLFEGNAEGEEVTGALLSPPVPMGLLLGAGVNLSLGLVVAVPVVVVVVDVVVVVVVLVGPDGGGIFVGAFVLPPVPIGLSDGLIVMTTSVMGASVNGWSSSVEGLLVPPAVDGLYDLEP